MSERVVWGLDLGQTGLRAVKLERGKGTSVRMTDTFFCPIDGLPDDPHHEDKLREAIGAFIDSKQPRQTPVVISLPGYTTLFRSFPLPQVHPSKLREVVYYEAKQLIPYPLEEVQWDFQQLGVSEENGEMQIALLCCRRDIIDNLLRIADEVGLVVEDVQVGPVALVNFSIFDNPPQGRAMLLDCGARSTDFVMFDTDSFWLRSIAVCGDDISRTLMNKFSISFEEAEQLKSNMSDAKQASRVFKVVEPVMRSLAGEAQRSFGYYRSTKRGASVDEMILAGNTFLMEGADQYMADSLDYSARTLDLPATIVVAPGVDGAELASSRQVYGIAAGLALQGLGLARFTCSLLPEARKLGKLIKKKEVFGWAAAGVIVLTVLVAFATTHSQKPLFERDIASIQQVKEMATKRQRDYEQKMQQFEPALKANRAMLEVAGSRGLVAKAADLIHYQIEAINQTRFNKVNPQPISNLQLNANLSQQKIIENLRANILNWPASRLQYETLLKNKTAEFKVDAQTNEDIKRDMLESLQMQVLRTVAVQHNRVKRTFLKNESYRIVKAIKHTDNGDVTWELADPSVAASGTERGRNERAEERPQPTAARNFPAGENKAAGEEKEVVFITISGFTVTESMDDLQDLNVRLERLKGAGLYLYKQEGKSGFDTLRAETDNFNTINLPAVYDPTPKKADLDAISDGNAVDRSEKIKYEVFAKEPVRQFVARLIYEEMPAAASKDSEAKEEEVIQKAIATLQERADKAKKASQPAVNPAPVEEKKPEAAVVAPAAGAEKKPEAAVAAPAAGAEKKPEAAVAAPAAGAEKKSEAVVAAPAVGAERKPEAPVTAPAAGTEKKSEAPVPAATPAAGK